MVYSQKFTLRGIMTLHALVHHRGTHPADYSTLVYRKLTCEDVYSFLRGNQGSEVTLLTANLDGRVHMASTMSEMHHLIALKCATLTGNPQGD